MDSPSGAARDGRVLLERPDDPVVLPPVAPLAAALSGALFGAPCVSKGARRGRPFWRGFWLLDVYPAADVAATAPDPADLATAVHRVGHAGGLAGRRDHGPAAGHGRVLDPA